MNEQILFTDITDVTSSRLNDIFLRNGLIDKNILIEIQKTSLLREWEGSQTYAITLEPSKLKDARISPFIVIKIKSDETGHETRFYSLVGKDMVGLPILNCYDVAFSTKKQISHLILEDFSLTHQQNFDYLTSRKTFQMAIDSLVEIHAHWWNHPKLRELSESGFDFYTPVFENDNVTSSIKKDERLFLKELNGKITQQRMVTLNSVFALFSSTVKTRYAKGKITLLHNDAHTNNFTYPKETEKQAKSLLFDWDSWGVGVGSADLGYMIGFWYWPDYRSIVEQDLVKYYYNRLKKLGVQDYSWEECWYDYRVFMVGNIYRIIWWWKQGLRTSIWWRGLEMILLTIEDLGCLDLLSK